MNYKGMLSRGKKKRRMSGGHTSALSTIHNSYGSTNCFRFEGVISANPRRKGTPLFSISVAKVSILFQCTPFHPVFYLIFPVSPQKNSATEELKNSVTTAPPGTRRSVAPADGLVGARHAGSLRAPVQGAGRGRR